MDQATVADRLALRDLVDAYASTADQRDAEGFAALFLPDAPLVIVRDGAEPTTYVGPERLAEIPVRLGRYRQTLHVVTNHRSTVDGDRAEGEALCQAHHLSEPDADGVTTDHVLVIRYTDAYARSSAGWRFASRRVHILWSTTGPVTTTA